MSSLAAGEVVEIHSGADGRDPHQQESGADDNPQPVGFRCEVRGRRWSGGGTTDWPEHVSPEASAI